MEETKPASVRVWYDGACPICSREIRFLKRLDRKGAVAFHDLCDPDAAPPLPREVMLERFHAEADGRLLVGARAFAAVWRTSALTRPLGLVVGAPGLVRLFDAAYLLFLKARPALQRLFR
jgi:predicted DCC family thiol-disulfide oxidoreductase YuxK